MEYSIHAYYVIADSWYTLHIININIIIIYRYIYAYTRSTLGSANGTWDVVFMEDIL